MIIKKRVELSNNIFFVNCDCEYKKDILCLKNYKSDYYDGGDLSLLIEEIKKKYSKDTYKKYDDHSWFITDCLYIYDNIPFISAIEDYYIDNGLVYSMSYITKEELDKFIKENNIRMKDNSNFKLGDGRTWNVK